jgi:predicted membrane channel-forming protein YqfA (hemolysin III family)
MVFVRVIVLLFLTAYSYSMGQMPPHELNGFGKFISMLFFIALPALYLLPTYEAWSKQHPNLTSIALVNIFLGWSVVGWVGAMVWAYKIPEPVDIRATAYVPVSGAGIPTDTRPMKTCPECAESILAAAVKCKHCGSAVDAPRDVG